MNRAKQSESRARTKNTKSSIDGTKIEAIFNTVRLWPDKTEAVHQSMEPRSKPGSDTGDGIQELTVSSHDG